MSYKLTENKLDIINKCWRKPKGQLRMNNPETHETSGSRHRMKTKRWAANINAQILNLVQQVHVFIINIVGDAKLQNKNYSEL